MSIMRPSIIEQTIGHADFDLGSFFSDTVDFFTDDILDYAAPILGVAGNIIAPGVGGAIGSALGSAIGGSSSAGNAAGAQAGSAQQAADTNWEMYKQSRQDNLPFIRGSYTGLSRLTGMTPEQLADPNKPLSTEGGLLEGPQMSDFEASPYYQYGLAEQEQAINRRANALGQLSAGGTGLDLQRNANLNAMGNYGNFVNDWISTKLNPAQSIAGLGQTSSMGLGQQGIDTGAYMGSAYMNAGNARASGYQAQSNIMNQGLQGVSDYLAGSPAGQQAGNWLGGLGNTVSNWITGSGTNRGEYNNPGDGTSWVDPQWNPSWGLG